MRGRKGGRGEERALSARQRQRSGPRLSWDYLLAPSDALVLLGLSSFKPALILVQTPSQGSSFPLAHQAAQRSHPGTQQLKWTMHSAHKNLPQLWVGSGR